jgi:hypothetical protein
MSAPENGAKAPLEVRKTEIVGENGLKLRGFLWESHYLKIGNSLPHLVARVVQSFPRRMILHIWHARRVFVPINPETFRNLVFL